MKRMLLSASAALMLGTLAGAVPARAQYDDDDDRPPPPRYERRYGDDRGYGYGRRGYYDEDRYERRRFRGGGYGGSICVTARGNCATGPAPFNAPCGCEIPGFGYKRGQIGSR